MSLQSYLTLCDPIDGSPPGSLIPGILQARTLEWVAISFSSAWKWKVKVKSLSRVQPLSNPMDCSLPGSGIHGIFQARVLEWVAIAFSSLLLYYLPKKSNCQHIRISVKNLPAMQETRVWSLGWEDPMEKGMATHSSILWRSLLGLEKKTTVSKALAESSNFRENKTEL